MASADCPFSFGPSLPQPCVTFILTQWPKFKGTSVNVECKMIKLKDSERETGCPEMVKLLNYENVCALMDIRQSMLDFLLFKKIIN